ncbi:MAG TPA: GNAT family N-acetyltransferase [Actinomycetota bacterium]|nr:GNAT family N-acetyltransferase [Actinomycetota bacterium]
MDIRIARADDWRAFREIRLRALQDAPDAFGGTHAAAAAEPDAYWRGWILGDGWNGRVRSWVADDRGRFRGMAVGARFDADPSTVNLFGMWVEPDVRGTGVATRLVGMVEAWARGQGATRLVLWVSDGNGRAAAFYAKLGFAPTGTPPRSLRDGSPVQIVEMERPLERSGSAGRSVRVGEP